MTEAEWLACDEPVKMLRLVSSHSSSRKRLLYLCAGVRSLWHLLFADASRETVEVLERIAEGQATEEEISSAIYGAEGPTFGFDFSPHFVRSHRVIREGSDVQRLIDMGVYTEEDIRGDAEMGDEPVRHQLLNLTHIVFGAIDYNPAAQLPLDHIAHQTKWPGGQLVREVFGNFPTPATISPTLLTTKVISLAQAAYEARELPSGSLDPVRIAILADALEDAGCTDAAILRHCRGPGPHVRGCWVVDLLTGRQ